VRILDAVKLVPHEVHDPTLIVIPTYNERENILGLLTQISTVVPAADVVVVDDRSPDGTAQAVTSFAAENPDAGVHLIERTGERGLGNAYRAGLEFGLARKYQVLVTMDADGSHSPLHLPAILSAMTGADVVIGSRYTRDGGTINWRIRRILLSWLANRFARFVLRLQGSDLTSGYRAYRRQVLTALGLESTTSNGYSFLVEVLYLAQRCGAQITEVPIIFYDRTLGVSKISKKEIYRGALSLLRLRVGRARKHVSA